MGITNIIVAANISIGAENVFDYSLSTVVNVILALIIIMGAIDRGASWVKEKRTDAYTEQNSQHTLEQMVEDDHNHLSDIDTELDELRQNIGVVSTGVAEVLQSDLMEAHDRYMARTPHPYITRYERLIYITMYDAYASLITDPIVKGFYDELLSLPVIDVGRCNESHDNNGG